MTAILAIARSTFVELRRQRLMIVPLIAVALSLIGLGGTLLLSEGSVDIASNEAELIALMTGFAASVGATLYAIIVGSGLIAREIVSGTMLMLAARPIGRWQIIAGRVLGAGVSLLGVLVFVCASYSVISVLTTASLAPWDEPFVALVYGAPAVLLGLTFGVACSVQGKATAATGTAMAIALFAFGVGVYAEDWRKERYARSFLTQDVQDQIDSNDAVVGPWALASTRALPFWVFARAVITSIEDHEKYQYDDQYKAQLDKPIDTTTPNYGYMSMYGPAVPAPATATGLPADATTGPGAPPATFENPKRPDNPDAAAFRCAEYGGAECFLGYRNAWRVKEYKPVRPMDSGAGLVMAWLAIPFWLGVAMLLLHRRRDLT